MQRYRSDYKFFLTYRTRWSDNDQYTHVNNAVYYNLIDSIVNTYLEEHCGCCPRKANESTKPPPPIGLVITSHCTFLAPLSFPQTVTLGLRVASLGRSSVAYEVGFFAEGDSENTTTPASAVGGYTHVFVDRDTRKPVREGLDAQLKSGLENIRVTVSDNPNGKRYPKTESKL